MLCSSVFVSLQYGGIRQHLLILLSSCTRWMFAVSALLFVVDFLTRVQVDVHDLNIDECLFKSFDVIIRSQLNPIWHKLPRAVKQLVQDLHTLRKLLTYVLIG